MTADEQPAEALRWVGVDAHATRLRADLETNLGRTRRGRLALRLSNWIARRKGEISG